MTTQPIIILVRPQLGENIGAAARAMMNFGLRELRLVAPRDGWPNDAAFRMAAHATPILDALQLFDTTEAALADIHAVYATTSRGREMPRPVLEATEAVAQCGQKCALHARTAFLFGPERTGLTNDDLALCDALLTIPTDPGNGSLNVAQSVVIIAYEWFRQFGGTVRSVQSTTSKAASPVNLEAGSPPATKEELQGFFDHLESLLDETDFFKVPIKKPKMWQNLRSIFARSALTEQEVRTLRGMIRSLHEGQ